jgi:FkbM family methyltransferase
MGDLHRVPRLARIMPMSHAFKLALRGKWPVDIRIYLTTIGRCITLRGATTDIQCFEQVFLDEEYKSPFGFAPRVIVDAGANIGMATLYFAFRYPQARILAIEPESNNFKILQQNCAGLPNVTLVQAALWPDHRRVAISDRGWGPWAYYVTKELGSKSIGEVSTITIDDIFRKLAVNNIDLLKLDIEGSERELFAADRGTWLERVEQIIIELHDRNRPGCSKAFYSAVTAQTFRQEIRGETIFIHLRPPQGDLDAMPSGTPRSSSASSALRRSSGQRPEVGAVELEPI